ncbi:MatE family protein [Tritrichomonas foetus]|uniref:MatE family protein n=1 Tax=Tritrichomonas foetus TaxID=1144522 RepID=A0A1J4K9H2_9EUKA|nr:MatE family protein [Tritrichomonas foetus]|eukprot:OHT06348.1 MatE family protein [Tritrichomonas foetus]
MLDIENNSNYSSSNETVTRSISSPSKAHETHDKEDIRIGKNLNVTKEIAKQGSFKSNDNQNSSSDSSSSSTDDKNHAAKNKKNYNKNGEKSSENTSENEKLKNGKIELEDGSENKPKGPNEEEIYRLAGRPPLITILHLMIGPIISQVTGALYGIFNTIWVSHGIGEIGLSAVATEITLEGIGRAFGYFLMISASTKISQLFGKGLYEECTQVVCDLLRVTLICGAFVPAVILPIHDPLCRWYGASPETSKLGMQYLIPLCAFSVFTCLNLCCQGFLQAEGRTLLIGLIDFTAIVVSCAGICPLFLYGFKTGINAASISIIFADAVPGVILLILYFKGKFGIKPKLNQLLKPFSKHTGPALLVGLSQLVSNLAGCIPGIPIRNLIGLSAGNPHIYDLAMAGFNVGCRFFQFSVCVCIAITTGFIAAGSYAHASGNDKRFLHLSFHAGWLGFAWSCLTTVFALAIPKQICLIFGKGEEYLQYSVPMLRNMNYLGFFRFVQFNSQGMLQALQLGGRAMLVSFLCNFLAFLGFGYLLFYTNKHDVIRLMWLYSCVNGFGFVLGIILLIGPLRKVYRLSKIQAGEIEADLSDVEEPYEDLMDEESVSFRFNFPEKRDRVNSTMIDNYDNHDDEKNKKKTNEKIKGKNKKKENNLDSSNDSSSSNQEVKNLAEI